MYSVINDENLRDFGALLISEPHVWRNKERRAISTPTAHNNWTKTEPTILNTKERWAYRNMIWTRSDLEAEQVRIDSSDITEVIIKLLKYAILLISVYVQGSDKEALQFVIQSISQLISSERARYSSLEIVVAGDFNRHDVLWGGERVSEERQGEAEPIIEMMGEQGLISLLKSCTITRDQGGDESTINLMPPSQSLANSTIFCKIHDINHGSDDLAIETRFNLEAPFQIQSERLLFKEAPWHQIREATSKIRDSSPPLIGSQGRCDRLMDAVSQAV